MGKHTIYDFYVEDLIQKEIELSQQIFFENMSLEEHIAALFSEILKKEIDAEILAGLKGVYVEVENVVLHENDLAVTLNYQRRRVIEYIETTISINKASLVEQADTVDLESTAARHESSNLLGGTK